jgi:hypothetical protein
MAKTNKEIVFLGRVVRNSFILAGLMFVSTFATGTLSWALCKPIVVFFIGYILTELARRYGITPKGKKTKAISTLIL